MRRGEAAEVLWRAIVYLSVVQAHLLDNVLVQSPLKAEHVKSRPQGHWGTVPGTAWILSNTVVLEQASERADLRLVPMMGAGHAGIVQIAYAWLQGALGQINPRYSLNAVGLKNLAQDFPDVEPIGSEVHPDLPFGLYQGGCIGGALAFSAGFALNAADVVAMPILGDGECETPTTVGSWLPTSQLPAQLLPIIHLNGFRMGSPSMLGALGTRELHRYFEGHGWAAETFEITSSDEDLCSQFQELLQTSVVETLNGKARLLIVRCQKGWGAPSEVDGVKRAGTAGMHKTPLNAPATNPQQLSQLQDWLTSYSPSELFVRSGAPSPKLKAAIESATAPHHLGRMLGEAGRTRRPEIPTPISLTDAVVPVIRHFAETGPFRAFSPDEFASNRLDELAGQPYAYELLAEEVLFQLLAGWTMSQRRGILVSYEAFAPLLAAGLVGALKQRRLTERSLPSLNLLLTSYGWHNVYTHGDPSFTTALLASEDPSVRVHLPADYERLAMTLSEVLASDDLCNVIVVGKHLSHQPFARRTAVQELQRGIAVWRNPDPQEPDLVLVSVGDIPARVIADAVPIIEADTGRVIRVVHVQELTVLGDPKRWPMGLTAPEIQEYFGSVAPVLFVTLGHPAAVWGLLANGLSRAVGVIGWREPPRPLSQDALATAAGLNVSGVVVSARRLLDGNRRVRS